MGPQRLNSSSLEKCDSIFLCRPVILVLLQVIPDVEFDIRATDTPRLGLHGVVSGWFYVKGSLDRHWNVLQSRLLRG